MRKHLLHLLLPLFMLLSQQGAVWHGIGHLTDARGHGPAGTSVAQDDEHLAHADPDTRSSDQLCEVCLAFDDLAASARAEPPVLALADGANVQAAALTPDTRSLPAPAPRSRGPPLAI